MLWKCCTQYASKFGKLSSGHRTGKGQFSLQAQRRAKPKNAQTTAQLLSSHTLAKWPLKFSKPGFNSTLFSYRLCPLLVLSLFGTRLIKAFSSKYSIGVEYLLFPSPLGASNPFQNRRLGLSPDPLTQNIQWWDGVSILLKKHSLVIFMYSLVKNHCDGSSWRIFQPYISSLWQIACVS